MKNKINFWSHPILILGTLLFVLTGCPPPVDPPVSPKLTTTNVSSIAAATATSGGNVTEDGGASVTVRGVCWNTATGPTTSNSKSSDGTGTGGFTSSITGLNPGITYYVKAYATNSAGTGYGNEVSFTAIANLPTVTTTAATSVTTTTATSGGNVTADGGGAISARGVCWGTAQNPTTANSKTSDGTGTGSFPSSISGLTPGTVYYVKAYATNSAGTAYGSQVTFTTSQNLSLATVTTATVTNIATTTATIGGNVTSDGNAAVTERGTVVGTNPNPTTAGNKFPNGTGTGSFSSTITGLPANTTYYVRAYAINSVGTSYGIEVSFKTIGSSSGIIFNPNLTYGTVTDIEGNVYKTIQIGTQTWMAENLKTTKYRNGDPIPNVTIDADWDALTGGAYCWYGNDAATYKATYGALYSWFAVSDTRNIAPTGWHIPTDDEWTTLIDFLGGKYVAGGKLKEEGLSHWKSTNAYATNESGFSALPAGVRGPSTKGEFSSIGYLSRYWNSDQALTGTAWYRELSYDNAQCYVGQYGYMKKYGFSVRCVKDANQTVVLPVIVTTAVSAITASTATSGGNISFDGGGAVTARGVCWSTAQNPTTSNSKTSNGTNTGSFTSSITGLTPGTVYYVRAYATNSAGTAYGSQITFTASQNLSLATITTAAVINITTTTATIGGNVTSDGNATVTERGTCVSTSPTPTTASNKFPKGTGTGSFSSDITGFTPNTTYYIRAYAINSQGTAYGNEVSFKTTATTSSSTVTDIDGNVYKTVTIGTQVWMAENLKATKFNDGSSIQLVTDNAAWIQLKTPGYSWYDNNANTYKNTYGALYNWATVGTGKLCPIGWHVPSHAEWHILTTFWGGESVAGGKLKEAGTSHWRSPNTDATNISGFIALPGGYRSNNGTFVYIGIGGNWWTSTYYSQAYAYYRTMFFNYSYVESYYTVVVLGYSVRCIMD